MTANEDLHLKPKKNINDLAEKFVATYVFKIMAFGLYVFKLQQKQLNSKSLNLKLM